MPENVTNRVHDCDEHPDCTLIVTEQDTEIGHVVSRSHHHSRFHAEHRLNLDYPEAIDHRGDTPTPIRWALHCDDCLPLLAGHTDEYGVTLHPRDHREALASVARERGLL